MFYDYFGRIDVLLSAASLPLWTILAAFTAIPSSGDRNPILHLCGFLVTTQLSALGTDKTILIPVVFHVLDPSDLVTKLLGFLCFVIG